jgi:HlyD family secretion protein
MRKRWLRFIWMPAIIAMVAGAGWGAIELYRKATAPAAQETVPVTIVKQGDVTFTVTATAELAGGKSQMLTAPMTGSQELYLTALKQPGEVVAKDEVVAQFDTTEQEFKLREAEMDLAEADQQVAQAKFDSEARQEEDRYQLIKARADLRVAELELRRNELLAAITARQNELAVEAARNHLTQLEHDVQERKATAAAGIAIHEAARAKAKIGSDTAKRNIDNLTLRAAAGGYVSVQPNTNNNFFFMGMHLPMFQVGDTVRPGMAVAQIPDLGTWELAARIAELDRGHLALGQLAEVTVAAAPGKKYKAKVSNLGATVGPAWDRRFECKLTLEDPSAELRPGMTAQVIITTQAARGVLWIPAQALFESDGRAFVYARKGDSFQAVDVKLIRRGESTAVIEGVAQGTAVALASPDAAGSKKKDAPAGATKALPKA